MAVVLIHDETGDMDNEYLAVVLPSHKVIMSDDTYDIARFIGRFSEKWADDEFRQWVTSASRDFLADKADQIDNIELAEDNVEYSADSDAPLGAFYYWIIRNFDSQSRSASIHSDEQAKNILKEVGWFNA